MADGALVRIASAQNEHAHFFSMLSCKAVLAHVETGSVALGPERLDSIEGIQVDSWSQAARLDARCPSRPPRLVVLRVNMVPWNDNFVLCVICLFKLPICDQLMRILRGAAGESSGRAYPRVLPHCAANSRYDMRPQFYSGFIDA